MTKLKNSSQIDTKILTTLTKIKTFGKSLKFEITDKIDQDRPKSTIFVNLHDFLTIEKQIVFVVHIWLVVSPLTALQLSSQF